jgi:predicted RNA polymerase sigma factor
LNPGAPDAAGTTELVARRSYGKLVAFLAARTGDVAAAEDALSDAFASALSRWREQGCPDNPEAWLLTVARRKLIDVARRERRNETAVNQLLHFGIDPETPAIAADLPDQRLGMLFACTHPAIEVAIRAPLMLQVVLGLNAKVIGSAFLTSPAAMGKRLVRAKQKIRHAGIPLRVPEREELPGRLEAVLAAIYAAFSEGWTEPGGTDLERRELAGEAIYLARLVSELLPDQAEAIGLLALLLHAEARRAARRNAEGEYVPLSEQDQSRWDWPMLAEAESLVRRASGMGTVGRYQLEAAIQSAHVYRCRTGQPNWPEILELYDVLATLTDSPVVEMNRALASAEVDGPAAALEALERIARDGRLAGYQPYWAMRAELLWRTGAREAAREAYRMAIGLEEDPSVRRFLQRKLDSI